MNPYWKVAKFGRLLVSMMIEFSQSKIEHDRQVEMAVSLRSLALDLGPTYVKLTQILSVRYDLFDIPFCTELQEVLDHGKPIPYSKVREILRRELGEQKFSKYIQTISPEPIGVASLGQVHRGTLKSGERIAIKVLRPGVKDELQSELAALARIFALGDLVPTVKKLRLNSLFAEFENWTLKETDYTIEAYNINRFNELFAQNKNVKGPKVYWELTTPNVLVTEFVDGVLVKEALNHIRDNPHQDIVQIKSLALRPKAFIRILLRSVIAQVLDYGFIHGDPHPSNIIITGNEQITYIDFGIVAKLTEEDRRRNEGLFMAMAGGDRELIIEKCLELDETKGNEDIVALRAELMPLIHEYETSYNHEFSATQFFLQVLAQGAKKGIEWPGYMLLIGKTLATYDGISQLVAPEMNLIEEFRPYLEERMVEKAMSNILDPAKITKSTIGVAHELFEIANQMPRETLGLVQQITSRGFPIHITSHDNQVSVDINSREEMDKFPLYFLLMVTMISFFAVKIIDSSLELAGLSLANILLGLAGMLVLLILFFTFKK